ncbi:MAG TPA: MSMEG_0569 family flavin-dependent oxidoreductase [Polyangiaceae bacterium]|nr:MSMEG_0569 family flavin-dependent oxidoreductase [Polyangiaceae bacterium]
MPEMHFRVRWPHGLIENCYSPSWIIEEYLAAGQSYTVQDFLERTRTALNLASERVRARYGFACSSALDQLQALEATARELALRGKAGRVQVLALIRHAARDARSAEREPFSVIVVGAGQAGLSASYWLKSHGVPHVVLEGQRIAHAWRSERWDSFCLVTPNWQCQLPGHGYAGPDPTGFMLKDEIVRYVESYAERYELPVREGVQVTSIRQSGCPSPRFEVDTTRGRFSADHIVIAAGGYHTPRFPEFAGDLPDGILQLHSVSYKNPEALPEGEVLVVGTGQSGAQIAEDLLLAGRQVHLCVGSAPRCARTYRGRDVVEWLDEMGHYRIPITQQKDPEALRDRANHYVSGRSGGHDLDLRAFARAGMKLYGPLIGVESGKLRFEPRLKQYLDAADDVYRSINRAIDDYIAQRGIPAPPGASYQPVWEPGDECLELPLAETQITSAIFCTGFDTDYSWIEADIFDERGKPKHQRGVTPVPGLYFVGLPWLHTWGSGRFEAVGRDAEFVVQELLSEERARAPRSGQLLTG